MTPQSMHEAWQNLGQEPTQQAGIQRLRLDTEAAADLFACVFWPSGRLGLLVEGDGAYRPAGDRIPICRGVHIVHEVAAGPPQRTILRVILEDKRLVDIFAVLSADLIAMAAAEATVAGALRRCIDRICLWQGLFECVPVEGLSDERQRGMVGELLVLETLLLPRLDGLAAVLAWVGPDPSHQDFIHGATAIEVKTSLAKRHARIVVASEKQLDERPHGALVLAHLHFDESASLGESLPEVVGRLRATLATDSAASRQFDDRLLLGGYFDVHSPLYLPNRWRLSSARYFHVQGDFPRLTGANLPLGVGDIRYSIIADDLGPFEISAEDAAILLEVDSG